MGDLEKLTKEKAQILIERIKAEAAARDNEAAHSVEDYLYFWFIQCVSEGMYDEKELIEVSNIVKSASDIDYVRWYS